MVFILVVLPFCFVSDWCNFASDFFPVNVFGIWNFSYIWDSFVLWELSELVKIFLSQDRKVIFFRSSLLIWGTLFWSEFTCCALSCFIDQLLQIGVCCLGGQRFQILGLQCAEESINCYFFILGVVADCSWDFHLGLNNEASFANEASVYSKDQ